MKQGMDFEVLQADLKPDLKERGRK